MNNFSKNPFGNNNGMNQTRIVSNYTKASKDGGRVSTEEVRKNMQQLKGKDVKITVLPNPQCFNSRVSEQSSLSNQNNNNNQSLPTPEMKPPFQSKNNGNSFDQMKMARDRMNNFRNMGRN